MYYIDMKMPKVDAKSILEKYEIPDDRKKTSLYLSEKVFKEFQKACKSAPAGKVMEDLMRMFIESARNKG